MQGLDLPSRLPSLPGAAEMGDVEIRGFEIEMEEWQGVGKNM